LSIFVDSLCASTNRNGGYPHPRLQTPMLTRLPKRGFASRLSPEPVQTLGLQPAPGAFRRQGWKAEKTISQRREELLTIKWFNTSFCTHYRALDIPVRHVSSRVRDRLVVWRQRALSVPLLPSRALMDPLISLWHFVFSPFLQCAAPAQDMKQEFVIRGR
jgi:hypothetical protein